MRDRLAWKYALGLELTDPGFGASVLCEFRARLIADHAKYRLFETMLRMVRARLAERAQAPAHRLDARPCRHSNPQPPDLCGRDPTLHLERTGNSRPNWLSAQIPVDWFDCYSQRLEEFRLPKDKAVLSVATARQQALSVWEGEIKTNDNGRTLRYPPLDNAVIGQLTDGTDSYGDFDSDDRPLVAVVETLGQWERLKRLVTSGVID
jgi:hypothetical protein